MVGQALRLLTQAIGIVVLARLLTPGDYGLVAMVVAIIGIGEVLRDFGLSTAAIQSKELTRQQRDNLFWLNSAMGWALAVIVAVCAPLIAAFYGDGRLIPITLVLASTLFVNGVATQYRADLNRSLRFHALAAVEVAGPVLGLGVAIAMAAQGYAYWALVAQQVITAVAGLALVWAMCRWFPSRPRRGAGMKPFLGYGGNLMGAQLLNYASRNVDSVVIGSTLGAAPLGVYNRAFELIMLPLNQLQAPATKVALPVLSRLQDEPQRYAAFLLSGQRVLIGLLSACFALVAAQAAPLVQWILGDQWAGVVPILQILCVAGIAQAATYATYWAFLSLGLTRSNFRLALVSRPLMILIVLLGSLWGLVGVAVAYAAAAVLNWLIGLVWIGRASRVVPVRQMLGNGARSFVVYAVSAAVSWGASSLLPSQESVLAFLIGIVAFAASVGCFALVWPPFRRDCLEAVTVLRQLRK